MPAKLERTNTPGIFRRHHGDCRREGRCDCGYVVVWRHRGRQHKATFRTLAEAREAKRKRESEAARGGELPAKVLLHDYAREWVERYQGTGRRGFREDTRDRYRAVLERFALRHFPPRTYLADIGPRDVADFIGWLVKQPAGKGRGTLSDKSVRNALGPFTACLATARREGLISHNPATGAALPHRPQVEDDGDRPRPFPRLDDSTETMELAVALIHPKHRLMFELLAATGVRRSELIAFRVCDLHLNGDQPHVRVRQRAVRRTGAGMVLGALKSRYARREVPIPLDLAYRLRSVIAGRPEGALVFPGADGGPYDTHHLHQRVLIPACTEAGVEWAGFHTFRHTVASRLFAEGRNAVQVQRWLGHHSPSFTLDTYVHLLDGDIGSPLEPLRGNTKATERPQTAANADLAALLEMAE